MPDLDVNLYLWITLLGTLAGLLIGSVGARRWRRS
jgi:hypothetical protein